MQVDDGVEGVDISRVMATVWKKRWLIISIVATCTVLAFAAAFVITPVYRVFVILAPANTSQSSAGLSSALGQFSGLASLAGINVNAGGNPEIPEALSVLTSRQFTARFIAENNLMPILYARKWDVVNNRWKVPPNKVPSAQKAFEFFDKFRSVVQDRKTGLITVQLDWRDPNQAANWANDLVSRLNAEMRSRAIARAEASVGYLEKELKTTSDIGVQLSINRLIESEIQRKMIANVTQEYVFRFIDRAIAPDWDAPLFPRKGIFALLGFAAGLMISFVWLLLTGDLAERRSVASK